MKVEKKPGTFMAPEEWADTAHLRRELVERLGHLGWSQMTVEQCDEAVRAEAKKRAEAGATT